MERAHMVHILQVLTLRYNEYLLHPGCQHVARLRDTLDLNLYKTFQLKIFSGLKTMQ